MKVCNKCNRELPADSAFCQYCGSNDVSETTNVSLTDEEKASLLASFAVSCQDDNITAEDLLPATMSGAGFDINHPKYDKAVKWLLEAMAQYLDTSSSSSETKTINELDIYNDIIIVVMHSLIKFNKKALEIAKPKSSIDYHHLAIALFSDSLNTADEIVKEYDKNLYLNYNRQNPVDGDMVVDVPRKGYLTESMGRFTSYFFNLARINWYWYNRVITYFIDALGFSNFTEYLQKCDYKGDTTYYIGIANKRTAGNNEKFINNFLYPLGFMYNNTKYPDEPMQSPIYSNIINNFNGTDEDASELLSIMDNLFEMVKNIISLFGYSLTKNDMYSAIKANTWGEYLNSNDFNSKTIQIYTK